MAKRANGSQTSLWQRTGNLPTGGVRARAADPDDGDCGWRTTARDREDSVRRHALQVKSGAMCGATCPAPS